MNIQRQDNATKNSELTIADNHFGWRQLLWTGPASLGHCRPKTGNIIYSRLGFLVISKKFSDKKRDLKKLSIILA